jgi:hypothetical protein
MHYIAFTHFPGGKPKALTFSYDDGNERDRRLAALFNKYGLKGTFHLNSSLLDKPERVTAAELKTLFAGHEVSAHGVFHSFLDHQPDTQIAAELREDCLALERCVGYPVRGMSYPYGNHNDRVVRVLGQAGIRYARTVKATKAFTLPEDFLRWHPTCHHRDLTPELVMRFLKSDRGALRRGLLLFYIWGHSFEFKTDEDWTKMEEFCRGLAGQPDVWYATNIEIYDYITALHRLEFSADHSLVFNPSALEVWFTVDDAVVNVGPGATLQIRKQNEDNHRGAETQRKESL